MLRNFFPRNFSCKILCSNGNLFPRNFSCKISCSNGNLHFFFCSLWIFPHLLGERVILLRVLRLPLPQVFCPRLEPLTFQRPFNSWTQTCLPLVSLLVGELFTFWMLELRNRIFVAVWLCNSHTWVLTSMRGTLCEFWFLAVRLYIFYAEANGSPVYKLYYYLNFFSFSCHCQIM